MKRQILAWINKRYKAIDNPDELGSLIEAFEADEGIQARLQMLDEFRVFVKGLKNEQVKQRRIVTRSKSR